MPIYEYRCQQCGVKFEVRQKFSDEPVTVHEACGGAVEKLISAPSFQFKGTGWYVTDYKKSGAPSGDSKQSDKQASPDSKDSKPGESKSGDSKSSDSKSVDSKSGDSKSSDSKSSDS